MKGRGTRAMVRLRALWLTLGVAAFMLFLMARLVIIQVADNKSLTAYEASFQLKNISLAAPRGDIIDTNGNILAMDVPRDQVVAAPRYVSDPAREARLLARYLPFSVHILTTVLSNRSWYAVLDDSVSPRVANKIAHLNLVGISVVPVTGRLYPDGTLASQVLGFVGSNDQGLAGIEYEDNRILAGKPGHWLVRVDPEGQPMLPWQEAYVAPKAGDTVQLTIDSNIEAAAQKWLKWGVKRANATNGTVIVMDVHTGAILALANWPDFNPNHPANATPLEETDYAVEDPFPPGSIFKPVTATAALTLGLVTPQTKFFTDGYKIVDGVRIDDWNPVGWGWITLTKGLEVSSDQVFMDVALKVGAAAMYHFMRLFQLDHPSGVGLPGDSNSITIPESQVNAVDLATIGFGQGMALTAMQMITADNAVANNGTLVKPHIVKAILSPAGRVIKKTPVVVESHPMPVSVSKEIQHMMTLEATYGTGVPAQVNGYIIAGKTGTSQKIIDGKTSNNEFVASYMGYGPMPHPKFIMLVSINFQHPVGKLFYGDQVSAPVWHHVASFIFHYWNIKPYARPNNGVGPGPIP